MSFLLVSLPLLYALAELLLSVDRLASQSRERMLQAAQAARTSRLLFEQATTLERVVRQQLILDDPALIDDSAGCARSSTLPGRSSARCRSSRLRAGRARPAPGQRGGPRGQAGRVATDARRRLGLAEGSPVSSTARSRCHRIDRSSRSARSSGCGTRRRVHGRSGCGSRWRRPASPLALAILFAVLIPRPIRQLDLAIRQMGNRRLHARDRRHRSAGPALPRPAARMAAHDTPRARGTADAFPAPRVARAQTPLSRRCGRRGTPRDEVGGKLTRGQQDIVRIVRENTLAAKLIEDLLKWHQTRAAEPATVGSGRASGRGSPRPARQKLAALARMIAFDTRLEPAIVTGDAERVRTIVDNLVSNAIKYSPRSGTITAEIRVRDGVAILEVSDQGPGVPAAEREHVFDSFFQGAPPDEGRVKGSGLGLAIAREYAMAHGGRIEAVDRPDGARGACFRLVLPLAIGARVTAPRRGLTVAGVE
ncbi:MAG: sensor histidine kinase [Betaproteobacteria bacterium]|nr:sensor histidine kinase [Betaproteobacteria bacterium]